MEIIKAYPPNFDQINSVFHVKDKRGIIFAYGDRIFNPDNIHIPEFLIAHEQMHCQRQGKNIESWWNKYINDIEFRYQEELYSHAAEFKHRRNSVKDRNERTRLLMWSAARLASPLYGNMISVNKAMQDINKVLKS